MRRLVSGRVSRHARCRGALVVACFAVLGAASLPVLAEPESRPSSAPSVPASPAETGIPLAEPGSAAEPDAAVPEIDAGTRAPKEDAGIAVAPDAATAPESDAGTAASSGEPATAAEPEAAADQAGRPSDKGASSNAEAVAEFDAGSTDEPLHFEVVATVTRFDTAAGNVPATVSVVDSEQAAARPANNADDLLRSQAAITGQRYQGIGNAYPHILTVRGIRGSDRLLVLLDGQPINNSLNGYPNLNLLPVDRIHRIEFVRGPFSALYGSRAMAGVVNVITERGSLDPGIRLRSGVGPHGAAVIGTSAADVHGPVEYVLSYENREADNYLGNGSEPNVDYQHHRTHARIDLFRHKSASATITGGLYRSDMGFNQYVDLLDTPGLEFRLRNEGRSGMDDAWGQLGFSWRAAPALEVRLAGSILEHQQRFHSTPVMLEGSLPSGYEYSPERVESEAVAYRAEALARWWAAEWLAFVVGSDVVRDTGDWRTFDLNEDFLKTGMDAGVTTTAGYGQAEATLFDDRFRLIAGARVDNHTTFGTAASPKIGLSSELFPGTVVRTSFGRAFRSPSLTELYQPAWQRIPPYQTVGNEALRPESLYMADLGLEQRIGPHVKARATGFCGYGHDLISLRLQSDNKERYINQDRIRTAGVEIETMIDAGEHLRLLPSYVYTYSENAETKKPLDYVPAHVGGLTVMGRVPAGKTHFEGALDARFVGPREYAQARDPDVRKELEAYALANLRLQWVWPSVAVFADAYNLWNARYHENEGILAPRFLFLAGLRLDARWPWRGE